MHVVEGRGALLVSYRKPQLWIVALSLIIGALDFLRCYNRGCRTNLGELFASNHGGTVPRVCLCRRLLLELLCDELVDVCLVMTLLIYHIIGRHGGLRYVRKHKTPANTLDAHHWRDCLSTPFAALCRVAQIVVDDRMPHKRYNGVP